MSATDAAVLAQLADAARPCLLPALVAALPPLTGREVRTSIARLARAGHVHAWPPTPGAPARWGARYEVTAAGRDLARGAQLELAGMPARPAVCVQPVLFDDIP